MSQSPTQRILVVDDDSDLRRMVEMRLKSWGYQVLTAADGADGIRIAEEEGPDLILLDILMPKIKGREVCAQLKSHPKTKHIPVIFLTALGLADHIKAGLDLGAEDYIIKPFDPPGLKARIQVCLLRHQRSSPS